MEYAYYAKLIKDGFHTQCTLDLESGAVKIQDVPFEFRNTGKNGCTFVCKNNQG